MQSLTQILNTVEKILDAETDDLQELADIAGIDAKKLYFRADLSGLDLREADIDFLLSLQTNFENAKITNEQRQQFNEHKTHIKDDDPDHTDSGYE